MNVPAVPAVLRSRVTAGASWEPMTGQFFPVFSKRKWSFMIRKQASRQPEAAESVGTVQPAGEHSADQHKNNTVVKKTSNGRVEKGHIGAREPSYHFAAAGKKLNKS